MLFGLLFCLAAGELRATVVRRTAEPAATLDVGINEFALVLVDDIVNDTLKKVGANDTVDESAFKAAVSTAVLAAMKNETMSVKQNIAKHWVDLKADKRDNYVNLVKMKFKELFDSGKSSYMTHVGLKFHTVEDLTAPDLDKKLEYVVRTPTQHMATNLQDYTDLLYMSNIFLAFHVEVHKTLALTSIAQIIVT